MSCRDAHKVAWTRLDLQRFFIGAACSAVLGCAASHDTDPNGLAVENAPAALSADTAARRVPQTDNAYTLFESLQVRPLAVSPDSSLLFATNTPDARLEVFRIGKRGQLASVGSVVVGLEPVAVAARNDHEVWVVNHLSDSVSVVDVSTPSAPRVVNTLFVGDEPRDIVFAGDRRERAFITTAHRGQNTGDDPDLFTPGGRADVWVFDADRLGDRVGGTRLTKLTLFADTPRGLAVSPDGKTVYAAAFLSGNQTTVVSQPAAAGVYGLPMPGPGVIKDGERSVPQPSTGLIVKYKPGADGQPGHWLDAYGTNFDAAVHISLPDNDVFAIDATQNPPVALASKVFSHVGTTLFNLALNPKTGKVYVSNTEAHNDVRFEGHNAGFSSVVGNNVDSRITTLDPASGTVRPVNLNPHIDHDRDLGDPTLSAAFPQDLAVSADGQTLYVVAQGSSKLLAYDTAQLEAGTLTPDRRDQIELSGGGPTGLALDEAHAVAFVLTRFDNAISTIDLRARRETRHVQMFNPEPARVTAGRRFLYDAAHTSKHGDQACAGCHIGGDFDGLAWDLGNPGALPLPITQAYADESDLLTIPRSFIVDDVGQPQVAAYEYKEFQPLKGPMTTQSLRGLDNHGAMHWRGDRNGAVQQDGQPFLGPDGQPVVSAQPDSGFFDELKAFTSFNVAFPGLVGNTEGLSESDMEAFAHFVLEIMYPPNPIRSLDNSLTDDEQAGHDFYFATLADGSVAASDSLHNCNGCHVLDRAANSGTSRHPGFFGSDGRLSFEGEPQLFKVAHLRNAYQKLGMFSSSSNRNNLSTLSPDLNPTVDAVRGFGFQHDGALATVDHFLSNVVFLKHPKAIPITTGNGGQLPVNEHGIPFFNDVNDPLNPKAGFSTEGAKIRRHLDAFVLAFDSNFAPIVGQQVTLTAANAASAIERVRLLVQRAAAGECDLVARGTLQRREVGFVYQNGWFYADSNPPKPQRLSSLRNMCGHHTDALTFTCAPPGSGLRLGLDRDGDGYADGDEVNHHSNPADPHSTPR